jgi:signal-transduction protein with cAMP-binding, CBS, and nucleotidyltransferase domain
MTKRGDIRVGEVMTREVKHIDRMATVSDAIVEMKAANVSSLAVERRDPDDEYGLLVVTDIAREVIAKNRSPDRVNVYEIMSKPVLTLPHDMKLRYAVRLLTRFELSRALVADEKRNPIGLVTLRDMVLRHAESEDA